MLNLSIIMALHWKPMVISQPVTFERGEKWTKKWQEIFQPNYHHLMEQMLVFLSIAVWNRQNGSNLELPMNAAYIQKTIKEIIVSLPQDINDERDPSAGMLWKMH